MQKLFKTLILLLLFQRISFNPDGKAVHKTVGFMSVEKFIAEATKALDPQKQYYTILSNYRQGKLDTADIKRLVGEYNFSGSELTGKLAEEYLKKLPESALSRKDVVAFMMQYREVAQVQEYAAKYLKNLPAQEYSTPENWLFISFFKGSKPRATSYF